MPPKAAVLALALLVMAGADGAAAQESAAVRQEVSAEISAQVRSFYFNLAHNDWEALTDDILTAKVVAHRPPPESLLLGGAPQPQADSRQARCVGAEPVAIEQAIITVEGDWAEVSVPHCGPAGRRDAFRLIRFGGRWRFVAVSLG